MATPTALEHARRAGRVLIGLQLAAMLAFSTFQYSRYALTKDFAGYSQAWWAIAHGNLDPWSTVLETAFWQNNAEFAMWPLSLLYPVYPHPIVLLWVQDITVAATEAVAFGWILDVIGRWRPPVPERPAAALAVGAVVAMLLDPWCYHTIAFDFHFEVFAALFATLSGWDLWAGRTRRLWIWVPVALAADVIGGLCVLGVGLSGVLAGRKTRLPGLLLAAVGLAWVLVAVSIGGASRGGHAISAGYGYLTGPHPGHLGALTIAAGALLHPGAVAHMLALRWPTVVLFLLVVDLTGVTSPWGLGPALVVFVPTILNAEPTFLRFAASFQSWPALPFVLLGSVMVVLRLSSSGPVARRVAAATGAVWATSAVVIAVLALPAIPGDWIAVGGRAAVELARARREIPARAEVIVSQGVIGRFAERDYAYAYPFYGVGSPASTFQVTRPLVVFVLTPGQGVDDGPVATGDAAVRFVQHTLHARLLDARSGVYVLAWSPPSGTTSITLPWAAAPSARTGTRRAAAGQPP